MVLRRLDDWLLNLARRGQSVSRMNNDHSDCVIVAACYHFVIDVVRNSRSLNLIGIG